MLQRPISLSHAQLQLGRLHCHRLSCRSPSFGAGSRAHARWAELTHLFAANSPAARRLIERSGSPAAALAVSSSGAPSRRFNLFVGCGSHPRALHESNSGRMQDRPPTALRRELSRSTSPGKLPAQSQRELASSQPFMHAGHSCGSAVRQSVRGTGAQQCRDLFVCFVVSRHARRLTHRAGGDL